MKKILFTPLILLLAVVVSAQQRITPNMHISNNNKPFIKYWWVKNNNLKSVDRIAQDGNIKLRDTISYTPTMNDWIMKTSDSVHLDQTHIVKFVGVDNVAEEYIKKHWALSPIYSTTKLDNRTTFISHSYAALNRSGSKDFSIFDDISIQREYNYYPLFSNSTYIKADTILTETGAMGFACITPEGLSFSIIGEDIHDVNVETKAVISAVQGFEINYRDDWAELLYSQPLKIQNPPPHLTRNNKRTSYRPIKYSHKRAIALLKLNAAAANSTFIASPNSPL